MKLNLHTHTRFSDGYLSFHELLRLGREEGLMYLVPADHDRTKAWSPRNIEECHHYIKPGIYSPYPGLLQLEDLKIPQGIELSANDEGIEVHLLGIYVAQPDQEFDIYLDAVKNYRWIRAGVMCERLSISLDHFMKEIGDGLPSRLHFGFMKLLEERNKPLKERDPAIQCARDAMKKYVGEQTAGYVSFEVDFVYTPEKAIKRILKSGGVPIWAHHERADLPLEETFKRYKRYANGRPFGIEVTDTNKLEAMMEKFGLVTIGNDFHGYPYEPDDKSLVVEVPNELGEELIKRLEEAHQTIIEQQPGKAL